MDGVRRSLVYVCPYMWSHFLVPAASRGSIKVICTVQDDSNEVRGNGDEELYLEVDCEETRVIGGTYCGNN